MEYTITHSYRGTQKIDLTIDRNELFSLNYAIAVCRLHNHDKLRETVTNVSPLRVYRKCIDNYLDTFHRGVNNATATQCQFLARHFKLKGDKRLKTDCDTIVKIQIVLTDKTEIL